MMNMMRDFSMANHGWTPDMMRNMMMANGWTPDNMGIMMMNPNMMGMMGSNMMGFR